MTHLCSSRTWSLVVGALLAGLLLLTRATTPTAAQGSTLLEIIPINPVTDSSIDSVESDRALTGTVVDTAPAQGQINFEARSLLGLDISGDDVRFEIVGPDGFSAERLERFAPFAAFGDQNGDFTGATLTPGTYTITATLCFNGSCDGVPSTETFLVTEGFGITDLVLVNPVTDTESNTVGLRCCFDTDDFFNLRAVTYGSVGSVRFVLDGPQAINQVENVAPYALFGDTNGDYNGQNLAAGDYTLTVTPFAGSAASGAAGAPIQVTFRVQ